MRYVMVVLFMRLTVKFGSDFAVERDAAWTFEFEQLKNILQTTFHFSTSEAKNFFF